jgi:hypothetical protein
MTFIWILKIALKQSMFWNVVSELKRILTIIIFFFVSLKAVHTALLNVIYEFNYSHHYNEVI